ncbi:MAG: hypothetical protein K6347_03620 [Campylobacterales bacterium]
MRLFLVFMMVASLFGATHHFSLHQFGNGKGNTLLVIGGIHGNEPGGYFAPAFLVRYYKITEGNLWVVPNLNRDSIIKFERGIYNDMNRKFNRIDPKDPDYTIIQDIKKIITAKEVDMILNLHDGYGFYHPEYRSGLVNPKAWGQSTVIDQPTLKGVKFGNLEEIAKKVNNATKIHIQEDLHEFNVKNTDTASKDKEMQKTLTFWAISQNKPAFAIETSKNIQDLSLKVYYQLQTIERFMEIMGIKFERTFELTPNNVAQLLKDHGTLYLPKGRIALPLHDVVGKISYLPVGEPLSYESDNPLITLVPKAGGYDIYNGHIKVTTLLTIPVRYEEKLTHVTVRTKGEDKRVSLGSILKVNSPFSIVVPEGYRVNVIGFIKEGVKSEDALPISLEEINRHYALDLSRKSFRVEVYKGDLFCGMIVVTF